MPEGLRNVVDESLGTGASAGYDHPWFPWRPFAPADHRWPEDAQIAVSVVLDLTAVEWPRIDEAVPPLGGRGLAPPPDFPRVSDREFGHRVGIFRLLEILRTLGIPSAAVIDVLTVEHYPSLLTHLKSAIGEFIAGGLSANRPITGDMSEAEERHYIQTTLDRLAAGLGERPHGWLGAAHGESPRTPGLLAELGLRYVADWCNDDRVYRMTGAGHDLWSFPLSWELSDLSAMYVRQVAPPVYCASVKKAFDVLRADARSSGRALGLHLHPWVSGQAFRAAAVEDALSHLRRDAWLALPGEIVQWCAGSERRTQQ